MFYRAYINDGGGAKSTADPATISDVRLDRYLVTVGRFRRFVAAWDQGSGYTPNAGSGKHAHLNIGRGLADSGVAGSYEQGWLDSFSNKIDLTTDTLQCDAGKATWTASAGENEKLPMNCINWFEAYAFCIWDGGFWASEAEYVYAAAGGSEQRRFPWGATDPGKANQYAIWSCNYPDGSGICDGTLRNIAPVGTPQLGAGKWGQLDLVGNMIEWYLDWFAPSYGNPCTNCADLADGSGRAPRDGYFRACYCGGKGEQLPNWQLPPGHCVSKAQPGWAAGAGGESEQWPNWQLPPGHCVSKAHVCSAGAGDNGEQLPIWQLPPGQSESNEQLATAALLDLRGAVGVVTVAHPIATSRISKTIAFACAIVACLRRYTA